MKHETIRLYIYYLLRMSFIQLKNLHSFSVINIINVKNVEIKNKMVEYLKIRNYKW